MFSSMPTGSNLLCDSIAAKLKGNYVSLHNKHPSSSLVTKSSSIEEGQVHCSYRACMRERNTNFHYLLVHLKTIDRLHISVTLALFRFGPSPSTGKRLITKTKHPTFLIPAIDFRPQLLVLKQGIF
jgi:hypothetical protein